MGVISQPAPWCGAPFTSPTTDAYAFEKLFDIHAVLEGSERLQSIHICVLPPWLLMLFGHVSLPVISVSGCSECKAYIHAITLRLPYAHKSVRDPQ